MKSEQFYLPNENFDIDEFLDEELGKPRLTKKGTLRKRKQKQPRKYFTEDTDLAIIEYLKTEDDIVRNKIYSEHIEYAFYKLAENIIHTFKFYYTDTDTIEELKHEVITVFLSKLHLFHHSKNLNDRFRKIIVRKFNENYDKDSFLEYTGNSIIVTQEQINNFIDTLNVSWECKKELSLFTPPKAYSYFGTIAKRYLIVYNEKNYNKLQEKAEIHEIEEDANVMNEVVRQMDVDVIEDNSLFKFMNLYIEYIDLHLNKLFPKTKDAQTAEAILYLFKKRDSLSIIENKKALYIYIREIVDIDTPQITKIVKKMKTLYQSLYNEFYEYGTIKM